MVFEHEDRLSMLRVKNANLEEKVAELEKMIEVYQKRDTTIVPDDLKYTTDGTTKERLVIVSEKLGNAVDLLIYVSNQLKVCHNTIENQRVLINTLKEKEIDLIKSNKAKYDDHAKKTKGIIAAHEAQIVALNTEARGHEAEVAELHKQLDDAMDVKVCHVTQDEGLLGAMNKMFGTRHRTLTDMLFHLKTIHTNISKCNNENAVLKKKMSVLKKELDDLNIKYKMVFVEMSTEKADIYSQMNDEIINLFTTNNRLTTELASLRLKNIITHLDVNINAL